MAPPILFDDVTQSAGIDFDHGVPPDFKLPFGTGAAFIDCNDDGHLDLWVSRRVGPNVLYQNDGSGHFFDIATEAGVADPSGDKSAVVPADYDNDGRPDVFVGRNGTNTLYHGLGDCRFEEVADASGLLGAGATQGATWGDYDGDGFLDLFTVDHTNVALPALPGEDDRRAYLFHNTGGGGFEDASELLGLDTLVGAGFASSFWDYDEDGDLDLYLVNDHFPNTPGNQLWRNDGAGDAAWTFVEVSATAGLDEEVAGMGLALGDIDNDGHIDLSFSNIGRAPLYQSLGNGSFEDVTEVWGVGREWYIDDAFTSWGMLFADFDCDGWSDYLIAGGGLTGYSKIDDQGSTLYRNIDGVRFEDLTEGSGATLDRGSTRTLVRGDIDNDGVPDVFAVDYGGRGTLLRTVPSGANWLIVDLEGTDSNRDAIGAQVRVVPTHGPDQIRVLRSGESLGAGHERTTFFGLGDVQRVRVEVTWPTGAVSAVEDVDTNNRIQLTEGG